MKGAVSVLKTKPIVDLTKDKWTLCKQESYKELMETAYQVGQLVGRRNEKLQQKFVRALATFFYDCGLKIPQWVYSQINEKGGRPLDNKHVEIMEDVPVGYEESLLEAQEPVNDMEEFGDYTQYDQ